MPLFRLHRLVAAAMAGIAGIAMSLPAAASDPVAVSFQAGNPWAQQVGSLTHNGNWQDYSVAIQPDKTLQVNLVSRNPNIFFKVNQQDERTPLVDTFKTGAKTWSTQNASAMTYTIHVYIDQAAIARGDAAKYALQIGQYGARDMQPASTPITFKAGSPWAQEVGSVDSSATAHDYTLIVPAGNTLQVNLITHDPAVHFTVEDQAQAAPMVDSATTGAKTWSTPVAAATNFRIRVYANPTAMPPGKKAGYAIQIGSYAADAAQPTSPAAATTTGG